MIRDRIRRAIRMSRLGKFPVRLSRDEVRPLPPHPADGLPRDGGPVRHNHVLLGHIGDSPAFGVLDQSGTYIEDHQLRDAATHQSTSGVAISDLDTEGVPLLDDQMRAASQRMQQIRQPLNHSEGVAYGLLRGTDGDGFGRMIDGIHHSLRERDAVASHASENGWTLVGETAGRSHWPVFQKPDGDLTVYSPGAGNTAPFNDRTRPRGFHPPINGIASIWRPTEAGLSLFAERSSPKDAPDMPGKVHLGWNDHKPVYYDVASKRVEWPDIGRETITRPPVRDPHAEIDRVERERQRAEFRQALAGRRDELAFSSGRDARSLSLDSDGMNREMETVRNRHRWGEQHGIRSMQHLIERYPGHIVPLDTETLYAGDGTHPLEVTKENGIWDHPESGTWFPVTRYRRSDIPGVRGGVVGLGRESRWSPTDEWENFRHNVVAAASNVHPSNLLDSHIEPVARHFHSEWPTSRAWNPETEEVDNDRLSDIPHLTPEEASQRMNRTEIEEGVHRGMVDTPVWRFRTSGHLGDHVDSWSRRNEAEIDAIRDINKYRDHGPLPEWPSQIDERDVEADDQSEEFTTYDSNDGTADSNYTASVGIREGSWNPLPDHPESEPLRVFRWEAIDSNSGDVLSEGDWSISERTAINEGRHHAEVHDDGHISDDDEDDDYGPSESGGNLIRDYHGGRVDWHTHGDLTDAGDYLSTMPGDKEGPPLLTARHPVPHGIELEAAQATRANSLHESAEQTLRALNGDDDWDLDPDDKFAYLESDSSINARGGPGTYEIVTHPATLDYHRMVWKRFFRDMPKGLASGRDRHGAGMHVNISRRHLDDAGVQKIRALVGSQNNRDFNEAIAGTGSRQYATFPASDDQIQGQSGRTVAVNLNKGKAVELRLFDGTTDYDDFMLRLEYADALAHYAMSPNSTYERSLKLGDFADFVDANEQHWPALQEFVKDYRKDAPERFARFLNRFYGEPLQRIPFSVTIRQTQPKESERPVKEPRSMNERMRAAIRKTLGKFPDGPSRLDWTAGRTKAGHIKAIDSADSHHALYGEQAEAALRQEHSPPHAEAGVSRGKVKKVFDAVKAMVSVKMSEMALSPDSLGAVLDTADDYQTMRATPYGDVDAWKSATGLSWGFTMTIIKHAVAAGFAVAGRQNRMSMPMGNVDEVIARALAEVVRETGGSITIGMIREWIRGLRS